MSEQKTSTQEHSQHTHHSHSSHSSHTHHHHRSGKHKHMDDSEVFKNNNLKARQMRKRFKKGLFFIMCVATILISLYVVYIYSVD